MKPATLLSLAAFACMLGACTKLTVENYDRLRMGMTYNEVKQLLGTPDKCSDVLALKSCTWGNEARYVQVNFVADQVVLFNSSNLR